MSDGLIDPFMIAQIPKLVLRGIREEFDMLADLRHECSWLERLAVHRFLEFDQGRMPCGVKLISTTSCPAAPTPPLRSFAPRSRIFPANFGE
jgi:hypothetical protein